MSARRKAVPQEAMQALAPDVQLEHDEYYLRSDEIDLSKVLQVDLDKLDAHMDVYKRLVSTTAHPTPPAPPADSASFPHVSQGPRVTLRPMVLRTMLGESG